MSRGQTPVPRATLGNVPLTPVSMAEAIEHIAAWAGRAPFRLVVTPNVDHVMRLQSDAAFRSAYQHADLSLADGAWVVWAARRLGLGRMEKVSGSDLAPALCRRGAGEGWRVFFAGGRDQADLSACLEAIGQRFGGLTVGGACPPRGFERDAGESERLISAIEAFGPHLLMMAVGAPRSEVWMDRHRERIGRGVGIGIGVAMRWLAGRGRRAPRWMQRGGLEWLFRLSGEPRRLGRRYLSGLRFFPLVERWKRHGVGMR